MGMKYRTVPIGQVTQWLSGGTPSRSVAEYWAGEIPWISASTLKKSEIHESDQHLTPEAVAVGSKMAPVGATLFLVRGSALYNEIRAGLVVAPVCFNQDIKALVPSPRIVPKFLTYSLLGRKRDLLKLVSTAGNSAGVLDTRLVQSFEIFLPPKPEQRAIAEALSNVDGLLGALEALIAKKRAIKQAAMQQLLTGKTRLPGFSGEWGVTTLGEVADIKNGATPSTQIGAYWNGPILWCTPTDITATSGKYLLETKRSITEAGFASCAASLLPVGALLLCSRATIGEIKIASFPVCTNQGFKSLVCKDDVSNEFLYYLLLTLKPKMIERSIGSTFLEISKRDVASIQLSIPTYVEQRAIAAILSDMDADITALERRRDKARAVKQGMMQQLLTGRVRLVQPKATTEKSAGARPAEKKHNWQFNEAVVISVLTRHFGNEQYPLGRMRYTKFSYLLHRREGDHTEDYLKKAAGPYNPKTRYRGPEKIALKKDYVRQHRSGKRQGFVAGTNVDEAERYFEQWYENEALQWLEQFRFETNDDLELLTTVDMAVEELRGAGEEISVGRVKEVIHSNPEWKPKLTRPLFSDPNIARAIENCQKVFDLGGKRTAP